MGCGGGPQKADPRLQHLLPLYPDCASPPPRSSHNWNTLFMGPNAVADAIAQKYSATKSQVFDHVSGDLGVSLWACACRMSTIRHQLSDS